MMSILLRELTKKSPGNRYWRDSIRKMKRQRSLWIVNKQCDIMLILTAGVFNKSNSKSKEKGKGKGKGKGGRKGKKNEISKGKSFEDYQDFLCTLDDSDEETKEGK